MADENKSEEKGTYRHYTDEEGIKGIQESGVIKESRVERGDAAFGDGIYATQLSPSNSKCDIVGNNYDNDMTTNPQFVEEVVQEGRLTEFVFVFTARQHIACYTR